MSSIPHASRGSKSVLNAVSLLLATVGLVASIVVAWVLVGSGPAADADVPEAPQLASTSAYMTYGGDDYTGIQNAAVDTEIAVREAANTANALTAAIAERNADVSAERWAHLWNALALLIVLLGFFNFATSLHRFAAVRAARV